VIIDGLFVEFKEYFVGFWIVVVDDFDVVLCFVKEGLRVCNCKVEVCLFL